MESAYIVNEQHVRIRQHFAGLAPRAIALVIDIFILSVYFYGYTNLYDYLGLYNYLNEWVEGFLFILPAMLYPMLFELLNNGQTIGKRLMNIRVVRLDGRPLNIGASLLRFLFMYIDTLFMFVGAVVIAVTPRSQRLGDLAAGTAVVSDRKFRHSRVRLDEYSYLLKDYRPHYVRAAELSGKQADIVAHVLQSSGKERAQRIAQLCAKVEPICGARESESVSAEDYLQCVLNDYRYYQLETGEV